MKLRLVLIACCMLSQMGLMFSQASYQSPFVLGETVSFESDILNETRSLNVYLPAGYSPDSAQVYPVIYLLDGSADEDFIHIAGLIQFLSFSWIDQIPPTILVGISNVDRRRDFTFPTTIEEDKKEYPTTGFSTEFISFIEKELIPFVDKRYKTSSERTLIGQSLGGLLATEILVKKTKLFNQYLIISPSLWWDNESLLGYVTELDLSNTNVFIAVGKEGPFMVKPAKALYKKLKAMKTENAAVLFNYYPEKSHGDVLHQAVYDGFVRFSKLQVLQQ